MLYLYYSNDFTTVVRYIFLKVFSKWSSIKSGLPNSWPRPGPNQSGMTIADVVKSILYQQKPFRWLGKCRVMMFRWKTRRKEVRKREERSFHATSMLRGRRPLGSQVGGASAPAAPPPCSRVYVPIPKRLGV